MNKRDFIKSSAILGAGAFAGFTSTAKGAEILSPLAYQTILNDNGEYELPPLLYAYDALEPYIDEATMRLHHDIHHAGYVKGFLEVVNWENVSSRLEKAL